MTAMRGAVVVAFFFLVACGEDGMISRGDGHISHVSETLSSVDSHDGPTRYFYQIELTMPKGIRIDSAKGFITMTDPSGRRFQAKEMGISTDSDGVQKVSAKFELPDGAAQGVLHAGDYDIDLSSSRVTRRAAAAPATP
jgi:hypothetical protein